jgi:uncharacterized protein (TIGR01777 family)
MNNMSLLEKGHLVKLKVVVTGATGFVGKKLCLELFKSGHSLRVVTRSKKKAAETLAFPAEYFEWSGTSEFPQAALTGADAVIHLAGESIADGRWSEERKKKIMESRKVGTAQLVKAMNQTENKNLALIGTSAIGFYGPQGSHPLDENSPKGLGFLSDVCNEWEKAYAPYKNRLVILRVGVVFGHGGALEKMELPFRLGLGGPIGNGGQWMSWIHIDDLINLYVKSLETQNVSGTINAVAPNPVSNREFTKSFAKVLGKPAIFPIPTFMLKLIFGEMAAVILDSQRVYPHHNFSYRFPTIDSALTNIFLPEGKKGAYVFEAVQWVPKPVDEVFSFFSEAKNLEVITPKWLNFQIKNMSTPTIQKGSLINYRLRIKGVPAGWRTLIGQWSPPHMFVDEQLKGPYSLWHHTHKFESSHMGTLMEDRVIYRVPLGPIGDLVRLIMIKSDIQKIFRHRFKIVNEVFAGVKS